MVSRCSSNLVSNRRVVLLAILAIPVFLICFALAQYTRIVTTVPSLSPGLWQRPRITSNISANPSAFSSESTSAEHVPAGNFIISNVNRSKTLGIASHIFVVSLPRRTDRRKEMEILRTALDLRWTYVEAIESRSMVIRKIMARTRMIREGSIARVSADKINDFRWPPNIDALSLSSQPLGLDGSDLWTVPLRKDYTNGEYINVTNTSTVDIEDDSGALPILLEPLTCAVKDNVIPPFMPGLPEYKILTLAKMACWNSHLSAIRRIAEGDGTNRAPPQQDISVILEDDIDMEWDIRQRLAGVWTFLPTSWDVVFLGE